MILRRSGLAEWGTGDNAGVWFGVGRPDLTTLPDAGPNYKRTEADNARYAEWEATHPEQRAMFDLWQGRVIPKRVSIWVYDFTNATPGPPPLITIPAMPADVSWAKLPLPTFPGWDWGDATVAESPQLFFSKAGIGDWATFLSDAGMNPWGEYVTIVHQHHINGATPYDRMMSLYRRVWNGWAHIVSFPFNDGSPWKWAQPVLRVAVAVVAMMGGQAWLSAEIGAAVLGSYATTYPALASAIGNIAISTAVSGGDVEQAVENAALSYVGGAGGQLVTSATDSATIGAMAAAATRAALSGGDVKQAIAVSLVTSGARSADEYFSANLNKGESQMDSLFDVQFADDYGVASLTDPAYAFGGQSFMGFDSPAVLPDENYGHEGDGSSYAGVNIFSNDGIDLTIGNQIPVFTDIPTVPASGSQGPSGGTGWVTDLTALALAAIKVNAAYQQSQAPIRTVTSTPDGRVSSPNADGTLTVRNANGQVLGTTKPQAGTPYVLPDGRTIINNGNGTYSVISASGTMQTLPYTAASGAGSSNNTMLLLGLGAVALVALG